MRRGCGLVPWVVLLAAFAGAPRAWAAPKLAELGCTSCHLDTAPTRFLYTSFAGFTKAPPPAPTGCAQCHVSNHLAARAPKPLGWLPLGADMLGRIRGFHAYVEAPPLVTSVVVPGAPAPVARFTACGLDRFLAEPLPRHGAARQSMYPVDPRRRQAVLGALGRSLEQCAPVADTEASRAAVARGRDLFAHLACATCHTGTGAGPRLRLGMPLLGRAYFGAQVRLGSADRDATRMWQRSWEAVDGNLAATRAGTVTMPAHPHITEAEIDALYAYVAADRSDVPVLAPAPPPQQRVAVPDAIRRSLYREVQKRVFDTSCRHCHSPSPRDQSLIASVFGKADAAPVELPMTRLDVSPSPTLRRVLSPGPGCSDSAVLARLKAREAEWSGHPIAGAPRGMPMTLPPLDRDTIRLVTVWSAAGCPSDRGDLCDACPVPQ